MTSQGTQQTARHARRRQAQAESSTIKETTSHTAMSFQQRPRRQRMIALLPGTRFIS